MEGAVKEKEEERLMLKERETTVFIGKDKRETTIFFTHQKCTFIINNQNKQSLRIIIKHKHFTQPK